MNPSRAAISQLNQTELLDLTVVPIRGIVDSDEILHNRHCHQAQGSEITASLASYADSLCSWCSDSVEIVGVEGPYEPLGSLTENLSLLCDAVDEVLGLPLGSYENCVKALQDFGNAKRRITSEFTANSDTAWVKKLTAPADQMLTATLKEAREKILWKYDAKLLESALAQFYGPLPSEKMFPQLYALALKQRSELIETLREETRYAVYVQDPNAHQSALMLDLFADGLSQMVVIPALPAFILRTLKEAEVAPIPTSSSTQEVEGALEATKVLFQPGGPKDEPYSKFKNAFEAALRL